MGISHPFPAQAALDLAPGDNVTVVAGALRRSCDPAQDRCDCERPNNASSAAAAPPDPPLVPVARVDGPTTAAACEGLSLGSSQSTGGGGRELAYAWNATLNIAPGAPAANASAARERLRGALAAANAGGGSANLALTSDDLVALAGGGAYRLDVVLALANFLGGASEPSEPFAVALRTDAPPQLTIVGGIVRDATRPGALSIRVNAIATSCDGRPAASRAVAIAFSLDYAVFTDGSAFGTATVNSAFDLEPTGLASTSSDQRYFKLPAYSLAAATYYRLAVTATDVAGGSNVTSYVRLDVARSSVVAVVAGGDRVAPLAGTLALDCVKINHWFGGSPPNFKPL